MKVSCVLALGFIGSTSAFHVRDMQTRRQSVQVAQMVSDEASRRDFFKNSATAALSVAGGLGLGVMAPEPANAVGGVDKVNSKLRG